MKSYPEYKETEIEWVGKLPSHWKVMPLKYAALVNREALTERVEEDFELQYIDIGNVNQLGLVNPPERMKFIDAPSRARRIIKKNDTIISTVRTYLKAVAFIDRDDDNLIVSTGFATLTSLNETHPKYLYYLVSNQRFVDTVSAFSTGVSYPAITSTELARITSWLPPLPEQKAIADFLDRKTAQIDALIEKKQRQIDLLQEQRTALINHAVTKGLNPDVRMKDSGAEWLGEIPSHWIVSKIKNTCYVSDGNHGEEYPKEDDFTDELNGVPFIRAGDIDGIGISRKDMLYITREKNDSMRKGGLQENDILLVNRGATIGKVALISSDLEGANLNSQIAYLRTENQKISHKYLLYFLSSSYFVGLVASLVHGGALPQLPLKRIVDIEVLCPPKSEQEEIVKRLDNIRIKTEAITKNISEQISFIQEYRTALISEAVTGKIDVRNILD